MPGTLGTMTARFQSRPDTSPAGVDTVAPVRRTALWTFAAVAFTITGTLRFGYKYLDDVARDETDSLAPRLIEEATGSLAAMLLFVVVVRFTWRYPLDGEGWRRHLPRHLAAMLVFSIVHTTLNWTLRSIAFPLAGLGGYDYGRMPVRYAMELGNDAIGYCTMLALITCYRYYQVIRTRELRTAQLERGLAQAQLQNLRLQLQPHFLFNALNTISSTMYDDPRAADRMVGQLSELLRLSLRTTHTQEVRLGEELGVLDQYLGIMRARFGEALRVVVDIEAGAESALVPSLLLQPLVENAVRHGNVARLGSGAIVVRARLRESSLAIDVADDGPGAPGGADLFARGVGLRATRERLRLLYGAEHAFEARNDESGFLVRMMLPLRGAEPQRVARSGMEDVASTATLATLPR